MGEDEKMKLLLEEELAKRSLSSSLDVCEFCKKAKPNFVFNGFLLCGECYSFLKKQNSNKGGGV